MGAEGGSPGDLLPSGLSASDDADHTRTAAVYVKFLAAQRAVLEYADGTQNQPMTISCGLTRPLRRAIHNLCAHSGLHSDSASPSGGDGPDKAIVVSRWRVPEVIVASDGAGLVGCQGARGGTSGQGRDNRWSVVSYDPASKRWTVTYDGPERDEELDVQELNDGMRRRFMGDMEATGSSGKGALKFSQGVVGGFSEPDVAALKAAVLPSAPRSIKKIDIFHWCADVTNKCIANKHSPLFLYWCIALSDAIFRIMAGERERRIQHYVKLGMNTIDIRNLRRRHFRPYLRYVIEPEAETITKLCGMFNCFVELPDPARPGFKILTANAKKQFQSKLRYVANGQISDPVWLEM